MSKSKERLESKLTLLQCKAAQMLVQNEWGELGEKKMSQTDLAKEIGIGRTTLYEYRQNEDFIAYVNYLSARDLDEMERVVNAQLMSLVRGDKTNGIGSVRAIELYYKRKGLLTERRIIETVTDDSMPKTDEDLDRAIAEVDELLAH